HNAKFDMRRLNLAWSVDLCGKIHCTETVERILRNDHISYSLDQVAKRRGLKKDGRVEEYISAHKLYDWVHIPGKKTREKSKKFWEVPFRLMAPYACMDARIAYQIGLEQTHELGL